MIRREDKDRLFEKYSAVVKSVSEANDVDMGVALDMIAYECDAHLGVAGVTHKYDGIPAGFDYAGFKKDITE